MSENNYNINNSTSYLGFSPNNFYYVDADARGSQYAPDNSCNDVFNSIGIFNGLNCDHDSFKDNSFNCLKKVMCNNKKLAETLHEEYSKTGSNVRYSDNKTSYNIYLIKITNLVIGISALFYFMYKNKNISNSTFQNNIN
jgi:hypothetical protein